MLQIDALYQPRLLRLPFSTKVAPSRQAWFPHSTLLTLSAICYLRLLPTNSYTTRRISQLAGSGYTTLDVINCYRAVVCSRKFLLIFVEQIHGRSFNLPLGIIKWHRRHDSSESTSTGWLASYWMFFYIFCVNIKYIRQLFESIEENCFNY